MKILQLLDYSQDLRHRYFQTLSRLPWTEVIKGRGASFPSLKDIFLHMIFVTDAYINYALQGNKNYPEVKLEEYDSIEKIKRYMDDVEIRAGANLAKMTPEQLEKSETLLLDFFQEETHHRGELLALLWQMDVEPPHRGFLQYRAAHKRKQ